MGTDSSDFQTAQDAMNKVSTPQGLQPSEVISAPPEAIPIGNAAIVGENVVTELPGEAAGPLVATTLADGAASGTPLGALGWTDLAGTFFSALVDTVTGSLVLSSIAIVGVVLVVGGAIYLGYHGGLNSKQAESLADQARDPNSDDTLQKMREESQAAGQATADTPGGAQNMQTHASRPSRGTQDLSAILGTWRWRSGQKECGADVWTDLTITDSGSRLRVATTGKVSVIDINGACLGTQAIVSPMGSASFDGQSLSIVYDSPPDRDYPDNRSIIGHFSGNNLTFDDGGEVKIFTKVP